MPLIRNYLCRITRLQGNSRVVALNALYAFIIKGGALAIAFFSTPLFISYFNNNEVLGLWYTLFSVLTWFLTFDFGVGNGIRNHLVKALVENNRVRARKIISSGIASVGVITIILSVVGCLFIFVYDLNDFFNIDTSVISTSTLRISALFIFAGIMLRFLLTTVSSIFYALQRSAVNNFISLWVSLLQLIYVLIFRFDNVEEALIYISFAYLIISVLPMITAAVIVFMRELRDCIPHYKFIAADTTKQIMSIGLLFFLCQIFYLLIANTNEFFISHYWGTDSTADYTFYYKITMLLSMMVSLALTPTWSMVTKALAEGNYGWLRKLFRLVNIAGIALIMLQFLIVPFMQPIMNLWLGKGQLDVDYTTAVAFACFGSVFIYSSMLSTIVCGMAEMRLQTWCYGIGAIAKIIVIVFLYKLFSEWDMVVWLNVIVLGVYCILERIHLNHLISQLKTDYGN